MLSLPQQLPSAIHRLRSRPRVRALLFQESGHQSPGRFEQDRTIEKERPVIDILQIEIRLLFRRTVLTKSVNLRETSQAGLDGQTLSLPDRIMLYAIGGFRTRAYKGHFAAHHIPELRQFR